MSEQVRKETTTEEEKKDTGGSGTPDPEAKEKAKKAGKDMDELVDEIDGILEENAEEFVKSYVQRGGE